MNKVLQVLKAINMLNNVPCMVITFKHFVLKWSRFLARSVWKSFSLNSLHSLEATHLIWEWIMKVKGPKNQVDFIEVLYVVVYAWGATDFDSEWKLHSFIGPRNAQIFSLNNFAEILIWPPDYQGSQCFYKVSSQLHLQGCVNYRI